MTYCVSRRATSLAWSDTCCDVIMTLMVRDGNGRQQLTSFIPLYIVVGVLLCLARGKAASTYSPHLLCGAYMWNKTEIKWNKTSASFHRNCFIFRGAYTWNKTLKQSRRGLSVVAITARDHALRRLNVIGWKNYVSWMFFNMRINMLISLKQL